MGREHGATFRDEIRMFAEDRINLSMSEVWTGRNLPREQVMALAEACVAEHQAYAPDLMEELQGMADATDLSLAELIVNNGFTDFIDVVYQAGNIPLTTERAADDCTAFLVPAQRTANKQAMFGQTWDMHASATPYVILIHGKPTNAPQFYTFTITGCVGMIGMNDAGISVGINNLMGGDGQIGVTWPFVVRKILQQSTLDDALACLTSARLAGAHNYLLMDRHGNGYNVEAMSSRVHITPLEDDCIVHTNHCVIDTNQAVERPRQEDSLASSIKRLSLASELLDRDQITPQDLMQLTGDERAICVHPKPPAHVETCGGAVMRPTTGDFWVVWGLPSENEYEHFTLN